MEDKRCAQKIGEIRLKPSVFLNLLSKRKMSRKELAETTGVTVQHIGKLIRRESAPSLPLLGKIAEIFGVEPYMIADGLEAPDDPERSMVLEIAHRHPELAELFNKYPALFRVLLNILLDERKK